MDLFLQLGIWGGGAPGWGARFRGDGIGAEDDGGTRELSGQRDDDEDLIICPRTSQFSGIGK